MALFDRTMGVLEKVLDLLSVRHRVIAANVANEETPGYRAKEVRFQEALSSAVRRRDGVHLVATHEGHVGGRGDAGPLARVKGQVTEVKTADLPLDANSVNLELEMAKLSDNAMHYNSASTMVAMRYRQLLAAIREIR